MAEDAVVPHKPIGRFRRVLWSAFLGGALGGVVTAQAAALIVASGSFGIHPWLYGLLVLLCVGAFAWIAHAHLRGRLRPFALAETLGGSAGMWIALLLLTPPVNPFAVTEPFVLDFFVVATLIGIVVGSATGLLAGAITGLLDGKVVDALRPWMWLLGGVIALAVVGGWLLTDRATLLVDFSPILASGGMLAGWIAQREYLRLESVEQVTVAADNRD